MESQRLSKAANPPALPDAAITSPDSSKSSVQSKTDAASPDAQDEAQHGQDKQRDKTALTIKLHLHAAIVVTKMLLPTQSVRAQTSAAQRHDPLLTAACKLLADLPKADDSAHGTIAKNDGEFNYLIKPLMQPAVALLQHAETSDYHDLYGMHTLIRHILDCVKGCSYMLYHTVLMEFFYQGICNLLEALEPKCTAM